ncbi:MAG: hypothetical protein ACFE68_09325 [Candidatus Hodarchaeota archaeon]
MKVIKIYLPENLDKRFRKVSMEVYGYRKGAISKAGAQAIQRWVLEYEKDVEEIDVPEDPVKAIRGMLSYVKEPGVILQHEASKMRAKKLLEEMKK